MNRSSNCQHGIRAADAQSAVFWIRIRAGAAHPGYKHPLRTGALFAVNSCCRAMFHPLDRFTSR